MSLGLPMPAGNVLECRDLRRRWGNDAFARLVGHGASVTAILPQLGVLAAYAAVLLTLASWRLRRVLAG